MHRRPSPGVVLALPHGIGSPGASGRGRSLRPPGLPLALIVRADRNARLDAAIASILVVDDDRDLCDLLDALLTAEGYQVWCVYDGEAAWAAVQQKPPDLILSDIKMPKLDGVTLALRLAEAAFGIPVILMSAGFDDWAGVASVFLRKPFEIEDLLASIAVAMR
jgi:CheY-like chemotaxis protein